MPPMMLLPLLERALAQCGEQTRAGIDVAVRRDELQLVICVRLTGAVQLQDDGALCAIRERLAALYGTNAFLVVAQDAGTTEARLALPFESAVAPASLSTSSRFAASSDALPA